MPSAIRQPQPPLEEESPAPSPDQPRHTDGRTGRSKEESGTADNVERRGGAETTGGTSHRLRNVEQKMRSTEPEKEKEREEIQRDARMLGEKKTDREGNGAVENSSLAEDVFDSGALKIALGATEQKAALWKLIIPSTASVRNKIHQFETLSQRAWGSAADQFPKSNRSFSVPAQPSGVSSGVKKSASDKSLGRLRGKWEGVKEGTGFEDKTREEEGKTSEYQVAQRSSNQKSEFMDEVGKGLNSRGVDVVESKSRDVAGSRSNCVDVFGKYSTLNNKLENREARTRFYIDETDFYKATDPEKPSKSDLISTLKLNLPLNNFDPSSSSPKLLGDQNQSNVDIDEDKTPTNSLCDWPFLSHNTLSEHSTTTTTITNTDGSEEESSRAYEQTHSTPEPGPYRSLVDLALPVTDPHRMGKKRDEDLKAWVASVNQRIGGRSDDDEDEDDDDDDDDDDDGTEKDEDSNYDSDSGESSVTVTSNMSQLERRSFSVSLADLCHFGGVDYESGSESDVWLPGCRSASLSSSASAFSCVSVLPTEELDRLLDDVRSLDDSSLQNYNDVQVVVLHKDIGVGLGFSVAGGADQNKPITVHKVFPLGAAAQEGSLRAGDQVLSINGTTLCDSGHWEATRTLRKAKGRGMGVVVLKRGVLAPSAEGDGVDELDGAQTPSRDTAGQRVCVQLEKQSRDLGFSLEGGVGSSLGDKPLSIQKVFQGGPVNQVIPGDEVVEIQGVNTTGMRRLEAWTLIRRLPPGPVDVILRRPLKTLST
ncbi:hypothetical protein NHX12_001265 [Muraenolepis orangiensis]|uniref:PDZ domain-containing protein n=1 Tax=Muraenolepis orangiensis TaxID=630683 RepID=A0A9Q0IH37_9TELE|nr:hypothetical protein NHX12_001265 [Muraenolepis orangiensis]